MDLGSLPLSRKQIEAIAGSTSRIVLYSGAVRSGKTIASLLRFLIDVAAAPRTGEIVVVAKTGQTAHRNLFTVLMNPDLFGPLAQQVQYTPGAPMAKVLGRTVHVIGANDERAETKLRGMTCCLIMVDEATLIPETFWNMALSRLSVRGAKLLATTNPDSPEVHRGRDVLPGQGDPEGDQEGAEDQVSVPRDGRDRSARRPGAGHGHGRDPRSRGPERPPDGIHGHPGGRRDQQLPALAGEVLGRPLHANVTDKPTRETVMYALRDYSALNPLVA
ncbi:terminase large subunit domain-containing protein [Streptomyces sp. NPDC056653]|uniref:terminase large subunit domain-containing protein n=1 Tax=Streptomyces sp. NPDC056653 TaxID=3345894 RepID=UPI0036C04178